MSALPPKADIVVGFVEGLLMTRRGLTWEGPKRSVNLGDEKLKKLEEDYYTDNRDHQPRKHTHFKRLALSSVFNFLVGVHHHAPCPFQLRSYHAFRYRWMSQCFSLCRGDFG